MLEIDLLLDQLIFVRDIFVGKDLNSTFSILSNVNYKIASEGSQLIMHKLLTNLQITYF